MYLHFNLNETFVTAVASDARSYSRELMRTALNEAKAKYETFLLSKFLKLSSFIF
jgi:hypothetical protein